MSSCVRRHNVQGDLREAQQPYQVAQPPIRRAARQRGVQHDKLAKDHEHGQHTAVGIVQGRALDTDARRLGLLGHGQPRGLECAARHAPARARRRRRIGCGGVLCE